ncbi:hypothetical protein [Nonomuraea sp. NPDC049646]|uniref:hypothetical protein n=1 Tax=unclassified Nonomuraea TaxID=2593643 RepID=UPI0037986E7C
MSAPRYQVVAACVTNIPSAAVSTVLPGRKTLITLMQGQLLPADVPSETIRRLLDGGYIAEIDG